MKRVLKVILALSLVCVCFGCSKKESTKDDGKILVSDLKDEESITKLKQLMKDNGVSEERINGFFEHVDKFNNCKGMEDLITEPKEMTFTDNEYDEYALQEAWEKEYSDMGYNCRITAMSILGDSFSIDTSTDINEQNILMDEEELKEDSSALFSDEDLAKFKSLFTTFTGENTNDQKTQEKIVTKGLKKMNFTVTSKNMSLVELYIHANYDENDNELFVGHTGVLFEDGDDLYFVEKLAFEAPYRFVKVDSRTELKDYLTSRYASYYGENEAIPFVLENGSEM